MALYDVTESGSQLLSRVSVYKGQKKTVLIQAASISRRHTGLNRAKLLRLKRALNEHWIL